MAGTMVLALVLAIPVILFPAALVWHLNFGGVAHAVKVHRAEFATRRAARGL